MEWPIEALIWTTIAFREQQHHVWSAHAYLLRHRAQRGQRYHSLSTVKPIKKHGHVAPPRTCSTFITPQVVPRAHEHTIQRSLGKTCVPHLDINSEPLTTIT